MMKTVQDLKLKSNKETEILKRPQAEMKVELKSQCKLKTQRKALQVKLIECKTDYILQSLYIYVTCMPISMQIYTHTQTKTHTQKNCKDLSVLLGRARKEDKAC